MNSPGRRRIDLHELGAARSYFFLISAVVPRPIAWVSTRSPDGAANLAPFSFFQGVSGDPPVIMLSIFRRKESGETKDTLTNIQATKEFVVNLVSEEWLETMVRTSAELPHGESEIDANGLATFAAERVAVPCLAGSPVNLECRLMQEVPIGGNVVVFGEILLAHVREDLLDARGVIDPAKLRPVARLGGAGYVLFDPASVKTVKRP